MTHATTPTPAPWAVHLDAAAITIRGPEGSGVEICRMTPWGVAADTPNPQLANAAHIVQSVNAATMLALAARPLVALTHAEALEKSHHGMRYMFCQCDALNPCWLPSYSPTGWGEHGPGKHWGGGDACAECNLRAAIFCATGSTT